VRRSNFALRVPPNVVQGAMRHASPEAKQRYQLGMVEHVRENMERANQRVYKARVVPHHNLIRTEKSAIPFRDCTLSWARSFRMCDQAL
jgi:hypothetical protein